MCARRRSPGPAAGRGPNRAQQRRPPAGPHLHGRRGPQQGRARGGDRHQGRDPGSIGAEDRIADREAAQGDAVIVAGDAGVAEAVVSVLKRPVAEAEAAGALAEAEPAAA